MTETIVHIYYNFTKNNPGCVLKVYLNGSLIAARRTIDLWTFNSLIFVVLRVLFYIIDTWMF